jgi:hypothetical protein
MKPMWKISFWICLVLLIATNAFWIYNKLDTAVAHSYEADTYDKHRSDVLLFKKILDSKQDADEVIEFLQDEEVEYFSFKKGNEFNITLNSFGMVFDSTGKLTSSELY